MKVKEEIQETIRILKKMRKFKSQEDIAVYLNYNPSYFSRTLNSEIIPIDFEETFFKSFPKSVYLYKETTDQKLQALEDIKIDKKSDAMDQLDKIKNKTLTTNQNEGFIPDTSKKIKCYTTVIPIAGQAGLFQVVYDDTYIEQNFQKEEIWVLPEERGEFIDLGVNGDSMFPTLQHNDRVRCKDVQRLFWRDENIFKEKIYCFWHNKRGIIYKRVKKYVKGLLILSSDNPNKKEYPDFEIDIDHCSRILVVTELVSRKNI